MVNLHNASPNTQQPTPPDNNSLHRHPTPTTRMPQDQSASRRVTVLAVPAVSIQQNRLVVGNGQTSMSSRQITQDSVSHTSHLRLSPFVDASQGSRRRFFRHRLVMRLAWDPTPQYSSFPYAMWPRCEARMDRKASCCRQVHAKTMEWMG